MNTLHIEYINILSCISYLLEYTIELKTAVNVNSPIQAKSTLTAILSSIVFMKRYGHQITPALWLLTTGSCVQTYVILIPDFKTSAGVLLQ